MAVRMLERLAASSTCLRRKRPRVPCIYIQSERSLLLCSGGVSGGGGGGEHTLNPISSQFSLKNTGGVQRRSTTTRGRRRRVPAPTPRRGESAEDNDEYRWMQDIYSDEVVRHLEHENSFAAVALSPLERRARELHRCMMERLPEEEGGDNRSVPERLGHYLYYTRRDDGKGFPLYVRRPAEGTVADEEVVLDLNEIEAHRLSGVAADYNRAGGTDEATPEPAGTDGPRPAPRLRSMKLSSDQCMLACTIDVNGADQFALAVFELGSGGSRRDGANARPVMRDDPMWSDVIGVEWGANPCSHDGKARSGGGGGRDGDAYELYYTVPDKLRRPWQVRRVLLRPTAGTKTGSAMRDDGSKGIFSDHADSGDYGVRWEVDSGSDVAVFEELDDAFFADVGKTKDHAFVVINVHSKTTSEVLVLPVTPAPARVVATATVPEATAAVDSTASRSQTQTTSEFEREENSGFDDANKAASNGSGGDSGNIENAPCRRSPTLLRRRQQGVEYYVDHAGDSFYLVTNSPPHGGAPSFTTGPSLPPTPPTPKLHLWAAGIRAVWQRLTSGTLGSTDNSSYGTSARTTMGGGRHGAVPENFPQEYRLVRVRQQPGRTVSSALEGISDAPWETVPAAPGLGSGDGGAKEGGARSSDKPSPCSDTRDSHRSGVGISGRTSGDVNHTRIDLAEEDIKNDRNAGAGGGKPENGGTIEEMDLFREHCVLYEISAAGSPRLRVVPLADPEAAFVVSPPSPGGCAGKGDSEEGRENLTTNGTAAAVLRPGVNSWVESKTVRFTLSSPTAPEDVYDMSLESGRLDLLRRTEVPGTPRFNGQDYSCYRVQVCSRDGEHVPLTIAHREGLRLDGNNCLLLHGYGAYGMSLPIDYHAGHACMLERGWVVAFAHVRGGGERGKAWHAAGRRQNKWNSFHDFEACAEHLVSSRYTTPSSMGLHVSSAGGLLAGVMANTRPDLFSAMVMKAPFLGVLSAMRDTSLPLTVHEFDEWGDPSESPDVEAMIRSYCPYENVRRHKYPALLVSASVNDTRVSYWDPAKWVSRVRANNVGDKPVLLRVSDSDAHEGPGNTVEALQDFALEMAFFERHLRGRNS